LAEVKRLVGTQEAPPQLDYLRGLARTFLQPEYERLLLLGIRSGVAVGQRAVAEVARALEQLEQLLRLALAGNQQLAGFGRLGVESKTEAQFLATALEELDHAVQVVLVEQLVLV